MLMKSGWPIDYEDQFWENYPRRIAKKDALKALDRIRKDGKLPFEVLLSATKQFARSMVGRDMKFVPYPATWLNRGSWDDDPSALLDVKVSAPAMQMNNGQVLIKRGSPQALAWEKHRGRSIPWGQSGVWAVASEWPPEDWK
jgi:hypothetical protein